MTISVNWTIILISQSLSTELKVYQEIKEKMTISVKDSNEKYDCYLKENSHISGNSKKT